MRRRTSPVAHHRAHGTDPISAYGGVIAANRPVTLAMAQQVKPVFTEVILAPDYEDEALELLRTKKNLRILRLPGQYSRGAEMREIWGGMLIQDPDTIAADGDDPSQWTLAAGEAADEATLADLAFAWRSVRAVKSNAILLAADSAAVGIGMGQVNRLDSCRLAVTRANTLGAHAEGARAPERARGAVAASDAFFPFADGAQILIDAGRARDRAARRLDPGRGGPGGVPRRGRDDVPHRDPALRALSRELPARRAVRPAAARVGRTAASTPVTRRSPSRHPGPLQLVHTPRAKE